MMKLLIWHDKHGDVIYDASTEEKWAAASLAILKQWRDNGYIYMDEDDPDGELAALLDSNDLSVVRHPSRTVPRAWTWLQRLSGGEYMDVEITSAIDATKRS